MLSSMVLTSCMLETRASSQLRASESSGPSKSLRAHSNSFASIPIDTSVGAIFHAFSILADSIHSARASSASLWSSEFILRGCLTESACSCRSNMHCFCSWVRSRLAEFGGELVHAHQVLSQLRAARRAAAPGLFSSCIRPAARVPSEAIFSCCTVDALHLLKAVRHVAQNGLADLRATGHQVPELFLVQLQQMAWCCCFHSFPRSEHLPAAAVRRMRFHLRSCLTLRRFHRSASGECEARPSAESRRNGRSHPGGR